MGLPRFFVPAMKAGCQLSLDAAESQHASSVLRVQVGDFVEVFDGCGASAQARIVSVKKRCVELQVGELADSEQALEPRQVELLVSLPKGDRQKVLVDGLTQMGVRKLTPLLCEQSVAKPNGNAVERIRRAIVESCKQCRRNTLMEVGEPVGVAELIELEADSQDQDGCLNLIAHPYESQALGAEFSDSLRLATHVRWLIGPEGGFTQDEVGGLVESGWKTVHFGTNILRIEMAALYVAARSVGLQ
ncbi:MAG: 16S rRNA (uracil(1498)-N(3))-methyltransferase [Pirellulaceae bacterium]